jgi:large subunit ribosomal protein L5
MADRKEPRLKREYFEKIQKALMKELKLDNVHQVPALKKIVVNIGLGEALDDKGVLEHVEEQLKQITGQKPVVTLAKGAVSGFKIRKGDPIGMKVTLRGERMWDFFDKLVNVVLPRTKDFRGLPVSAFDGGGNYTVGLDEQTAFPEIDPNKVDRARGLEMTIVIESENDEHSKEFLSKFNFPFVKDGKKV